MPRRILLEDDPPICNAIPFFLSLSRTGESVLLHSPGTIPTQRLKVRDASARKGTIEGSLCARCIRDRSASVIVGEELQGEPRDGSELFD